MMNILDFIDNLKKLSKDEIIDLLGNYWYNLKKEAERDMNNKDGYMIDSFSCIKMTQVNRLKILTKYQNMKKKSSNH